MRLNCLDLTRYGKFTDASLSFGAQPTPDQPDLHVVYGPNEAGKSTVLSAWLDLLFQIPVRSTMGFLHPFASMQIGAGLEIDGSTHDLVRVKKRDHSLLDAQAAPIGEALLHGGLRGLDRGAYAAMFSLNRQTLDEGGESILASEGDLGELLFQASAGLTDLATQLAKMRAEADEFLTATGRKGQLRDLRAESEALDKEIKSLDTAAADYARLAATRDAAQVAWDQAREVATATQSELSDLQRLADAMPLADRLDRLQHQISAYGDLPVAPAGWIDELAELDRAETGISTRAGSAAFAVQGLERELAELPLDDDCLAAEADFMAAGALKAAHDTALADLPRRLRERDAERDAIRDSLARLDQPGADAAALVPQAAITGRLRDLIERHSGIDTALTSAVEEHRRATAKAEQATAQLTEKGGAQADLGGLGHLVQQTRRDDPQGALDRLDASLEQSQARVQTALTTLAPWQGTAEELAAQSCPDSASLEQLAQATDRARRAADRDAETLERLNHDREQAELQQGQIGAASAVTLADAAQARASREAAWRDHRTALDPQTADHFEQAMRLDDQITASVSDQRARAAKAADAAQAVAKARHEAEAAAARAAASAADCEGLSRQLAALVTAVSPSLPADMALGPFRSWLEQRTRALEMQVQHVQLVRDRAGAASRADRARTDLAAALALAGHPLPPNASLTLALETAQSLADRAAEITALRRAAGNAQQEVARREQDLEQARAAQAGWAADWTDACTATWMAGAPPNVPAMRAILEELDRLRTHTGHLGDLDRRIGAMEDNRDRFEQSVRALAARLDLTSDAPVPDLWQQLTARLRNAQDTQTRKEDLNQRLRRAQTEQQEVARASQLHQSRTSEFGRYFATATWEATRAALTRAGERAKLDETCATLVDDLCTLMRTADLSQALDRLKDVDPAQIEPRIAALEIDLETVNSNREEAHTALRQAERAVDAVGGDGVVARMEERRQTLLLDIEDRARRHLRHRLGSLAVETALRRYRDTHRSGMMDHASDAFRQMTAGRYTGLAAQPDGQREVLVALAAEGGSKEAVHLSEGTRAQLYLALRIAGYHEFVRNNGPVPFVADDIMESFDDARAMQTFALLRDMSRSGQVIYLTHHEHLCDIARAANPDVQIHALPG